MRQRLALLVTAVTFSGCGGYDARTVLVTDPRAVSIQAQLEHGLLPANQPTEVVVRLRIHAPDAERYGRPQVNLALVLDTSGSMEGQALEDVKAASTALVDALQPGDRLALIVFHSKTEILVPSTVLTPATMTELKRKIAQMKAWGTTDLEGGLTAGLTEVTRHYARNGINRVVLLGDGVPNDASNIVPISQAAGEQGVPVTALGFGLDYDETLMAQIAQRSGGRFHYIEKGTEVAAVFQDEVLRLERSVAKNMMVTITPGPGMAVTRVIGHPVQGGPGKKVAFGIGSLSTGQTRDLIVRLQSLGRRDGANVEVLDAELAFEEVLAGAGRVERRVYVGARAASDAHLVADSFDVDVSRGVARMEAADAVIQSIALARTGQVDQGKTLLEVAEREARASATRLKDDSLAKQADQMRPLKDALPSLVQQANAGAGASPDAPGVYPAAPAAAESTVKRSHEAATSILTGE